jgi:hypothetical protein
MKQWYWWIRGYDSSTLIFETRAKVAWFSDLQIQDLLRALVAKAGLTYPEIVGAYATRRTKIPNYQLRVHKDPARATYMCGLNPHFTASIIDSEGTVMVHELQQNL